MITGRIQLTDGTWLRVTDHAAARYHERVCSALDKLQAREHMARLAREIGRFDTRPEWLWEEGRDAEAWVTLGPDIAFAIGGRDIAVTCMARGGLTPALEFRRSRRRQAKRARARRPSNLSKADRRLARSKRRDQLGPTLDEAA